MDNVTTGAIKIRITAKELARVLGVPDGLSIRRLNVEFVGGDDALDVVVIGEGLPVLKEGALPSYRNVAFNQHLVEIVDEADESRLFINWGVTLGKHLSLPGKKYPK